VNIYLTPLMIAQHKIAIACIVTTKAHHFERLPQRLRFAGRILDVLDAVQTQRIGGIGDGFTVGNHVQSGREERIQNRRN